MAFTALDTAYVLDDTSVEELIELEKAGSAPVSDPSFSSRLATPDRLTQLAAIVSSTRAA